ncbi:MAG: hypothetical protein K2Z81_11280 [Cyanobacteria bacterium]|nr:hypothetical protein [Cyanobacteriota bacterium]
MKLPINNADCLIVFDGTTVLIRLQMAACAKRPPPDENAKSRSSPFGGGPSCVT